MSTSKETIDFLRNVPLFNGLNNRQLKKVVGGFAARSFSEGEIMVKQGDRGEGLFIVVSGEADAIRELNSGESRVVNTFGSTDFFGELTLLNDGPRTATVAAKTDVECLVLTRWDFIGLLKNDAEMAVSVLQELARRFRMTLDSMF